VNPILLHQLRKHLPADLAGHAGLQAFLGAIDATFTEFQQHQAHAEHTLDVVSAELTEANEKIRHDSESRLAALDDRYRQTLELQQAMILCFEQSPSGDFIHTLCSGRLVRRLGWDAQKVIGHTLDNFLAPHQSAKLKQAYATAWTGYECQVEITSRDDFLIALASLRPRIEGGRVREVIVSCVEITALKLAQAEAHKLALVAARTDNAVVITNAHGYIEWTNEGFTRITGYTFQEVVGRKPGTFLQGPETDPDTILFMRDHLSRGESFRTEIFNYGKGNRRYWLALEVQPIRDEAGVLTHFMAVESDITQRRQNDESLRVQFALAQALAGSASLADARHALLRSIGAAMGWRIGLIWMVDTISDTLFCADHWIRDSLDCAEFIEASCQLALARNEALPGRVWASATTEWHPDLAGDPNCPRSALALRHSLHCAVALPIHIGGKVLGVVEFLSEKYERADEARLRTFAALGTHIGQFFERVQAEDTLRRRSEELVEANTELARASRLKDAFLASMSHELRTPLNSILGLSESLVTGLHGPLNDKQTRYLELVGTSGRHLLSLINDILDLAKIESGQQELECEPCRLSDLCNGSIQLVAPMAAKRRQELSCEVTAPDLRLHADARRLKQVLVNLLGNAVKFTPEGGRLGLRVHATRDDVRFEIWDRGIGISATDLPRLFTPFQQLDSRLSRQYEGTGLGLSLVKQLTALHGGRVEVASRSGEGSTFTVILPASLIVPEPPPPDASLATADTTLAPATTPAEKRLILIADDNPLNVLAIHDYLEIKGYRVEVAENGRIAIEKTRTLRPSLIVMDVQMPVMDGLEATRTIRALPDPTLAATPIIALTALAMSRDRELCLAAGANDCLVKPCNPSKLLARITTLAP
jgi:PAS domain S-box-containing protein